jgi:hypothetical protein
MMNIRQNPWLKDTNRRPMISVKISSLNLHGTGRRQGFLRPTEIFTTMFKMEIRLSRGGRSAPAAGAGAGAGGVPGSPVGGGAGGGGGAPGYSSAVHAWTQARTFDEFRTFYERLVATGGVNAKEKLSVPFPVGKDGEADVFILLERKDEMELLIQDVVANLDFLLYRPLFVFLGAEAGLDTYTESVVCAQALIRSYIRRKSVLKELCQKYEEEQVCIHVYMYTYICVYVYIYVYIYIYIYSVSIHIYC